jgi:hypothetical protein
LFVAHEREVYPAGFLPIGLGSIRTQPLREIYLDDPGRMPALTPPPVIL